MACDADSSVSFSCVPFIEGLLPTIASVVQGRVRTDLTGRDVTTIKSGGGIRALVTVHSNEELAEVLALLDREGQQIRILGNGSNLLLSDQGVGGWIIKLGGDCKRVVRNSTGLFFLGAAAPLMPTVRKICEQGFSGLEFAGGIPASVGGAVYMNAGAHGAELCERIVSVQAIRFNGEEIELRAKDLPWQYRYSGIPHDIVVTGATLALSEGDSSAISKACDDHLKERRARQPLSQPSFGSVFKNPSTTLSAGKVLEDVGLKGKCIGGMAISSMHANWIVNTAKEGTTEDAIALVRLGMERARERGINLEPEVRMWDVVL